jgi:transcriptional regulator with XRE-family HTH domain
MEKDKTQADLYRYMKVSSATVSDWCNAKKLPRMDKIQSIANWLMVDLSELLYESTPDYEVTTDDNSHILLENFSKLSDPLKKELLRYADYLLERGVLNED